MSSDSSASGGLGIFSVLTIVFIVLKLTDVISWSWFWVLSPTIFSMGVVGIILLFLLVLAIVHLIR